MGIVDKFLGLIGFEEGMEEGAEEEVAVSERRMEESPRARDRKKGSGLVSLPQNRNLRLVVAEPRSFDEVQSISDQLKSRRPVVLNLEGMEKDLAQKFLNFLSGTVYALDGAMQRVGTGIFVFTPNNIEIAYREKEEGRERGLSFFRP